MIVRNYIKKEQYYDSVFLMRLAAKVGNLDGVHQISVGMGTPLNKSTMKDMKILAKEGEQAGPNDLIIAVLATSENIAESARAELINLLFKKQNVRENCYRSLDMLSQNRRDINLAVISVAGKYAGLEAKKALEHNMNVFMFSDNVPIEQEVELKQMAKEKGLFMMGPSCGLCFINGVAIGLCSKTRRGTIGIVGASGSGIQEVMSIIHRNGKGISQAIGTGGRDLSEEVGGITMLQGIQALEEDEQTSVIVLISKPPAKSTEGKILFRVRQCKKPVIIQFIGGDAQQITLAGAIPSSTFEETALRAIEVSGGRKYVNKSEEQRIEKLTALAYEEKRKLDSKQRYLRGIFCGGTLAEESIVIIESCIGNIYSNLSGCSGYILDNPFVSEQNAVIDIGEEEFTKGKPHVAIDPAIRIERFIKEAQDPETAVILLDFLLGYGVHEDPAGVMAETIKTQKALAQKEGRHLGVIASICGTELDPQGYTSQKMKLEGAGVLVMDNNGIAARLAAKIISMQTEMGG